MCQGVSRTDSSHMYSLIVMYPQFQCSCPCPIVQMRDKIYHMGKVMTQVIIKQLTYCMNAPLHVCHSFPFCLPLCLRHSQSFSHHTTQPSAASISSTLQLQAHRTLKLRGLQGKVWVVIWTLTTVAVHCVITLTVVPACQSYCRSPTSLIKQKGIHKTKYLSGFSIK